MRFYPECRVCGAELAVHDLYLCAVCSEADDPTEADFDEMWEQGDPVEPRPPLKPSTAPVRFIHNTSD